MTDLQADFLTVTPPGEVRADLLVIGCPEGREAPVDGLPEEVAAAVGRLASRPGWQGREKQYVETTLEGAAVTAVGLQGLGREGDLRPRKLERMVFSAAERARQGRVDRLALRLAPHPLTRGPAAAERLARWAMLAQYRFDRYLTDRDRRPHRLEGFQLLPSHARDGGEGGLEELRRAAADAPAVAGGIAFCRDLGNTPANVAHPEWMEEQARALAASHGLEITVLGVGELEERGMGGVLAVGGGSANEPRLVRLDWGAEGPAVALVGKGVTFDTGGISIKPSSDMDEMKYDKCGACTVLGLARAVAELELPVRLRAYVPLAENMPDGSAYRPGDIVTCYNGKTVEIINTDAEGRMILADTLAWASEESPDWLLEYSTLTGSSVVALGPGAASLYSPDDPLAEAFLASAEAMGERLWRMPLWPEFGERMKGNHADLKNSSSRWGSANTAAAFLAEFVTVERWAHLDIAGSAYVGNDEDEPAGATGYGIPSTLHWLRRQL